MSYPILYDSAEKYFSHNGFGILADCVQCEVTEEANGEFDLLMRYPIDGIHFEHIRTRRILKVRLDLYRDPQLFRIYSISKPMSKIVTVRAHHVSYDLSGIPVSPFSAESAQEALSLFKEKSAVDCPFDFWTDKENIGDFSVPVPSSIRSSLFGQTGGILGVYGGEYEFDNYTVKLYNSRGEDRGVVIRYGKNLLDIDQEENVSAIATGVYPYWASYDGSSIVQLPERVINASGNYDFVRILPLDSTQYFSSKPTEAQLRSFAQDYITKYEVGVPIVSLSVSFAQTGKSAEYKLLQFAERVSLFDTISVEFPLMMVSTKAKVVKIVYDILLDKIKNAHIGTVKLNIADTIADLKRQNN